MLQIKDFFIKYHHKLESFDLELIIARVINKPREFVLAHPEYKIPTTCNRQLATFIKRRIKCEPLAYIFGEKEFYGLKFKVNKNVLVPRPETEQLVELVLQDLQDTRHKTQNAKIINVALNKLETHNSQLTTILDLGTGSGNIIISVAKKILSYGSQATGYRFYGIDISKKALQVAKQNAKLHKLNKKIKFLHGSLLKPVIENWKLEIGNARMIILANLPYLSFANYNSSQASVKIYEPKKALLGGKSGFVYYKKLLEQLRLIKLKYHSLPIRCYLEISPEQKLSMQKLVKKYFPKNSSIAFYKDLAYQWRICEINL